MNILSRWRFSQDRGSPGLPSSDGQGFANVDNPPLHPNADTRQHVIWVYYHIHKNRVITVPSKYRDYHKDAQDRVSNVQRQLEQPAIAAGNFPGMGRTLGTRDWELETGNHAMKGHKDKLQGECVEGGEFGLGTCGVGEPSITWILATALAPAAPLPSTIVNERLRYS